MLVELRTVVQVCDQLLPYSLNILTTTKQEELSEIPNMYRIGYIRMGVAIYEIQ